MKRGDRIIQKELGPASYVGMKSTFSSDIETCTVVPGHTPLPVYQVLDSEGRVHDSDQVSMSSEEVLDIYKQMVSTHVCYTGYFCNVDNVFIHLHESEVLW